MRFVTKVLLFRFIKNLSKRKKYLDIFITGLTS